MDKKVLSVELQALADRAYCQYTEQLRRPECKGVEHKLENDKFGVFELAAHNKAYEYLGRHRAFSEAVAILTNYGQPAQPAASAEPVLSALLGMQRFFGKWPEFVPAPEYMGAAYDAVKRMNSVLSSAPVAAQPSVPEGWPTKEMVTAFAEVFSIRDQKGTFAPAFRAALAAAPTPPAANHADRDAILAAARHAGWAFAKHADGIVRMVPLVTGEAQAADGQMQQDAPTPEEEEAWQQLEDK